MKNEIKTCEFARKGHPDRICDILADSLLDEYLKQDPTSRVAIEVFGCHGIITIGGEITSNANVNIPEIVKQVYHEIGYKDEIGVQVNVVRQSPEISNLADEGAGDSGIITGYATRETKERLPLEVVLAKRIANKLDEDKRLLPDGKVQVTLKSEVDFKIEDVVVSYQAEKNEDEYVKKVVNDIIVNIDNNDRDYNYRLKLVHFKVGGFEADTGLTGRKNILWYGPRIPTGGGAFAGKDPTKVDRSGAYWARKIAIDYLEIEKIEECFVEIAYAIGQNNPISIKINGELKETLITDKNMMGITVSEVIEELNLRQPIYKTASLCGHFGYKGCPWE